MSNNIGTSGNANYNNVNAGNIFNGVGKADISTHYTFHGNQHGWMDSAEQDELYESLDKIKEPVKRMRLYSRKLGVDPMRKDVRVRGKNGYIPADELVHIAAGVGDCQAIDLLKTKYAANVNVEHQDGWRPIHRAAEGGQIEAMNMLAGRYQVDVGQRTDKYRKVTLLHSKLALLHIAASQGRLIVIDLLAGKMGPQTVKMGSLQPDVKEGHENEDPFPATKDDENKGPLLAIEDDENENTESNDTVSQPKDSDSGAVRIEWIPGDPNVRSNDKWTPMHFAALNDKRNVAETIERLKSIGGKVDLKDIDKWTPLHVAVCRGNWIAVQTLLKNGADVNARCHLPYGATPLCIARLARKLTVEKRELDRYALVITILKSWGARDRSAIDAYVGRYSGVLHLRHQLELLAWDMVDDKWVTKFSAKADDQKNLMFNSVDEAADFVNDNYIDVSAIIGRSIWYNIWLQAIVLSILLFVTFLFAILEINTLQQYQEIPTYLIWVAALSLFEILALFIFGVKAGGGKPSGTIAHYLVFHFYFVFFWIFTCIPLHYRTVLCEEIIGVFYGDYWRNTLCTDLNVTEGLAWGVSVVHLLHSFTIFKQAYKYFPPDVVSEEKIVHVVFVDEEPVPLLSFASNDKIAVEIQF